MSEVESVKLASDNGQKQRWGIKRFLYRQDGKKLVLERKYVLSAVLGTFVISSFIAITKGPIEVQNKSPIEFNGVATPVQTFEVPVARVDDLSRRRNSGGVVRYGGLQVVKRPGLGKIPPGTMGKAKLLGGASNGAVSAVLLDSVVVNGETLVESGTKLFGVGSSNVDRLNISFSKFIFKDGTVQDVKALACDGEDRTVGIRGSKTSRYMSGLAAGAGLNFVAGMAEGLQSTEVQGGVAYKRNTIGNAALQGAAKASIEQSKEMIQDWKEQKKIIQVKDGTVICLLFEGE
jgi:hypothetical protein